jgi:hypothetical protein
MNYTYASGEEPKVGDVVTKRGHKPRRPAVVLDVTDDGGIVTVRWGDSKGTMLYGSDHLVLVGEALREDQ